MKQATFGAGCFWGVEAAFRQVPGVISTAVGYSGGRVRNPSYEDVCTDQTGHAEVVQVDLRPGKGLVRTACSKSSGRPTTRPSSTARGPTLAASTARSSFITTRTRRPRPRNPRPTSNRSAISGGRSSPRSCRPHRSIGPRNIISNTSRSAAPRAAQPIFGRPDLDEALKRVHGPNPQGIRARSAALAADGPSVMASVDQP